MTHHRRHLPAIAFVAASSLVYEVLLTRVCALRLAFHFSFLVVAHALLAVGAAGALLYLLREKMRGREEAWLRGIVRLQIVSLPATYAFLLAYPVPYEVSISTGEHSLAFLLYNLVAAVPMFFAGGAIGLFLTMHSKSVHRMYAADLLGAAVGCLLCPYLLWFSGAGGALLGAAVLGCAGLAFLEPGRVGRVGALVAGGLLLVALPWVDARFPVPSKTELQLTEDVSFTAGDRMIESRWSAISRVDLAEVPVEERNLFMRSNNVELPRPEAQAFVMQDGSAGTYVHDYTGTPEGLRGLHDALYSLAARVLKPASVFIIGVGGGDDLWAHARAGTESIKGIELNQQILDIHTRVLPEYSKGLVARPGVEMVHGEGRTQLLVEAAAIAEGAPERDLVQMSAIDTWTALQSGAYMLAENFLYTQDAIDDMFAVLSDEGAVQITRFSQDSEAIRLLATLRSAHERFGQGSFADCVVCVPSYAYMSVLVKRVPLTAAELDRFDTFLRDGDYDLAYHPRLVLGNTVETFIRSDDPDRLLAEAPVNLTPVTDDKPYFFNYTRWTDLGRAKATIDSEMTVSQGNPLFLFGQLGLALLASLVLLGVPLLIARRGAAKSHSIVPVAAYFGAIGAGFIGVEVALMQKLVLMVGHPLYSVTVTLASMLLATGLGSYLSRKRFDAPTRAIWIVPIGLALLLGTLSVFDHSLVRWAAPFPDALRFLLAAAVVAPIGLLVGIPFAHGLRLIERTDDRMVPWAWAANAVATVVGSIATVIVSMNFGFRAVFVVATLLYVLAALCAPKVSMGIAGTSEA